MLSYLQIRDFAIVDRLDLEFSPGMTVMTGETGAGKSIMVDAIGLLLGDRADTTAVRAGASRAEISAVLDLQALPAARDWLTQRDLHGDQDCHLRRVIGQDGRSRAYINDTPQTLQALRDLGELLVNIHGQHAHHALLKRGSQRQLLDDYAGNQALLAELADHFQTWSQLRRRLTTLQQADAQRDMRLEYLRYQTQELEALNLQPDELIQLEEEHLRLANADRLLDLCQRAMGRLYDDDEASAQVFLSRALHDIQDLGALDMRLAPIGELLNTALIQVQEAGDELRRYMQTVELDPNRLGWIEQRLSDIHTVARKHRLSPPELPALSERLRQELEQLDNSTQKQAKLEQDLEAAWQRYSGCAAVLSGRRAEAATQLSARVSEAMAGLGMPGGRFELLLEEQRNPSAGGLEAVELLVSANPGQPLRPLSKVASGGELSRISLAIQVITAHSARIPTLVFDEVDTGIGGGIAEVVGQQLRALGADRQVLCVTHLPQVAAHAHHHLQIRKQTSKKSTRTEVWLLDEEQRVTEIARMLGGLKLTENTMAHAREMIEHAR